MLVTASVLAQAQDAERMVWFGTWKEGLAAARESGRPILLVAAAPQCHEVPGMW